MTRRTWIVVGLTFLLTLAPSALAGYSLSTSTGDDNDTERILRTTGGTLMAGQDDIYDCWQWGSCDSAQGISLVDIYIGDEMDAVAEEMAEAGVSDYKVIAEVWDTASTRDLTGWGLCQYEDDGTYVTCYASTWSSSEGDHIKQEIDLDTDWVRLILLNNVYADYNVIIASS